MAWTYLFASAGTTSVNGPYAYGGVSATKNYYVKAGATPMYVYWNATSSTWRVSETLGSNSYPATYYYNSSTGDDPDPPLTATNAWTLGGGGTNPVPTVTRALTFGNVVWTSSYGTEECKLNLRGSVFTLAEAASVTSVTAYVGALPSGTGICAIYDHTTLVRQGVTNAVAWPATAWWTLHSFASPLSLAAGDYVIAALATTAGLATLAYTTGAANQGHYQAATYPTFPDPLVPTHTTNKNSIYATYTATPATGLPMILFRRGIRRPSPGRMVY